MSGKKYIDITQNSIDILMRVTIIAPLLALCSAVMLTILKICGFFPDTGMAGVILFDAMCLIYLAGSIIFRHCGLSKKNITGKVIWAIKLAMVAVSVFHWNLLIYVFSFDSLWAYEPLFVLIAASFFDSKLLLIDIAGLGASIITAGIIGKGGFIPSMGNFYSAEVLIRWFLLILSNTVIYSMTKHTEHLVDQAYEHIENLDMFAKSGAVELIKNKAASKNGKKLLEGIMILLVDDNELARDINKSILEAEGATVMGASSGESAVHKFKDDLSFDVVLMDIVMPGMGGIEAIRKIRAIESEKGLSIPIVAISGEASEDVMKTAISAGADEALTKPLDVMEFSRILIASLKDRSSFTQLQLQEAKIAVGTDALTHVKSISAYTDKVTEISDNMDALYPNGFAVVMCDINGLKVINDTLGHDAGDTYIKNNCKIICDVFNHSPVYRIGGDEFVVILEGISYINRKQLFNELLVTVDKAEQIENVNEGKASMAAGMSSYRPGKDSNFGDVLKRADVEMYARKKTMKASRVQE